MTGSPVSQIQFLPSILCMLVSTLSSKESDVPTVEKIDEMIAWREHIVPGAAVMLRLKRTVGKSLIYEGSISRTQQSINSYEEQGTFYLNLLCADSSEGMDQVAIWRTFTDRKRSEKLENGKKIERALDNSNELIDLGPNFNIVGSLRCYAFDTQNRLAYHSDQLVTLKDGRQLQGKIISETAEKLVLQTKEDTLEFFPSEITASNPVLLPYIFHHETPHYLFPIFSGRSVSPGDVWKFKVPIIIPIEQGSAACILPTQFNVSMVGRLREVREINGGSQAIVDYQVVGAFDSKDDEFSMRLPAAFHDSNHLVHKVSGEGELVIDVKKGWIVQKHESFTIELYAKSFVMQQEGKPAREDVSKAEITSSYDLKLLEPGTRLKSGAVVPKYE